MSVAFSAAGLADYMLSLVLANRDGFRLQEFLFMAFFLGIAMSLILVYFHRYGLKYNVIQGMTAENLSVSQTKNLEIRLNKNALIEIIKSDPIAEKMKMEEIENGILLKTGMAWKSWGEEIKIITARC